MKLLVKVQKLTLGSPGLKFIQGYSWMCNTMALLFVKQQQTIALAH